MTRLFCTVALLIFCAVISALPRMAVAASLTQFIGKITEQDQLIDGCSCTLFNHAMWNANDLPIFVSSINGHHAWMNIAGNTEPLRLYRLREPDRPLRIGDLLRRSYWSRLTRVTCDLQVTSVCDGKSECAGFTVSATISVSRGSRQTPLTAYGVCAC